MNKEKIKKALDVIGLPRLIVCSFFFAKTCVFKIIFDIIIESKYRKR